METYIKIIIDTLGVDSSDIELISNTNNLVFKVNTKEYGTVYAKFYLNNSTHIDHELDFYDLIDSKYLKEVIVSSKEPKFAIFKELKGKSLDELSSDEISLYKDKIIDSLIYFYNTLGSTKINGYGLIDSNMNGTSDSFSDFIYKRQMDTQSVLKDLPILNDCFTKIISRYSDLITGDNSLVPIDTNAKNIMITDSGEVKFIDPGEVISAPILMGYGDFVAHTYKTELYDCLISKLNLSEDDLKRLRIYAIFSSLNILAFLKKLGLSDDDIITMIPYGNKYSFFSLIQEHLDYLGIEYDKNSVKINEKK